MWIKISLVDHEPLREELNQQLGRVHTPVSDRLSHMTCHSLLVMQHFESKDVALPSCFLYPTKYSFFYVMCISAVEGQ